MNNITANFSEQQDYDYKKFCYWSQRDDDHAEWQQQEWHY